MNNQQNIHNIHKVYPCCTHLWAYCTAVYVPYSFRTVVISKAALSSQLFEDPESWSGRGSNPWPPAQQTGPLPTELTRLRVYNTPERLSCRNKKRSGIKWKPVYTRLKSGTETYPIYLWLSRSARHSISCSRLWTKHLTDIVSVSSQGVSVYKI